MDNNEALVVIVFMLCVTVITVTFIMFGRTNLEKTVLNKALKEAQK